MNNHKIELITAKEVGMNQVRDICAEHDCSVSYYNPMENGNKYVIQTDDPINFFRLGRAWLAGLGDNGTIISSR